MAAELGFSVHKLKANPKTIVEIAKGVQEVVGDRIAIGVDPNTRFLTYHDTLRLVRQLEPYCIADLEDPFKYWGAADQYRLLRQKTDIPSVSTTPAACPPRHWISPPPGSATSWSCMEVTSTTAAPARMRR